MFDNMSAWGEITGLEVAADDWQGTLSNIEIRKERGRMKTREQDCSQGQNSNSKFLAHPSLLGLL